MSCQGHEGSANVTMQDYARMSEVRLYRRFRWHRIRLRLEIPTEVLVILVSVGLVMAEEKMTPCARTVEPSH